MVFVHGGSSWLFVLLVFGLAGLLAVAFRFVAVRGARSKALLVLRAAALVVVVLILLNPSREEHEKHVGPPPSAVFLLDESRSMNLESPLSRAKLAREILRGAEDEIPADRRPAIQKYAFGRDLSAVSETLADRPAGAEQTRLAWALEQLPTRFEQPLPFGVFVFSDGRSTEPEPLEAAARAYHELGVPIHVVPLGDERISGDVAVQDIDAPREARPGTRVPIRVTLRSHGYDGERTEIVIRPENDPQAPAIATLPLTLSGGEQTHELVVETDRARGPLDVAVQALPNEAIAANNVVPFQVMARPKKLRVLYMQGAGEEYRWVHDALSDDPNITCVSLGVDDMHARHPRLFRWKDRRLGFPTTREELLSYDVVISGDIAHGALSQQQIDWTVELVSKRGGGFVMIGGNRSFNSGEWDRTPWEGMVPFEMCEHGLGDAEFAITPFKVVIAPEELEHPIWKIVDDPARNREVLDRMPLFTGTNLMKRLKPAAKLLGLADRHLEAADVVRARLAGRPIPPSRLLASRPDGGTNGTVHPLIFACQSFGRGRTFGMATSTTWAWGTEFERSWGERDNRYFRKFWRNVVYWVAENSTASEPRMRLETDKVIHRSGEPIGVAARVYDEKLNETTAYRVAARLRSPAQSEAVPFDSSATNLTPQLEDPTYRGSLAAPLTTEILENPGSTIHQALLDVAAFDGDRVVARSSLSIQIIDDPVEFRDPRPDRARLEKLAHATGGGVIHTSQDLATQLTSYPAVKMSVSVHRRPLWDNVFLWLLLFGLLTSEWILRRVKGLA